MNSLRDGFLPSREKDIERPTPQWGRFTNLRENDVGKFREFPQEIVPFPQVASSLLQGKVTILRKKENKPFFLERELRADFQEVDLGIDLFL